MHILVLINCNRTLGKYSKEVSHDFIDKYDLSALEAAVNLFNIGVATKVTVANIGSPRDDILKMCLALGASHAVNIVGTRDYFELDIAKILKAYAEMICPDLIILGSNSPSSYIASMAAALLSWPQIMNVSNLKVKLGSLECLANGCKISSSLPSIITTDITLNEPRIPTTYQLSKVSNISLNHIYVNDLVSLDNNGYKVISKVHSHCKFLSSTKDLAKIIQPLVGV
jgi:electron transfer flavoprotein alpha/beta subunit